MSWFHVDDKFHGHPKVATADEAGIGAWAKLGSWSSLHQTDGRIPGAAARKLCTRKGLGAATKAGLLILDTEADVYAISGYLRCNPSAETVAARRDKWAEKKRTARDVPRGLHGGQGDVSPGDSTPSEPGDSSRGRARSPAPAPSPAPSPDPDQRDPGSAGPGQSPGFSSPDDWIFDGPPVGAPIPAQTLLPIDPPPPKVAGAADRVFAVYVEGWRRVVNGTRPPVLSDDRRRLINARLRIFPVEDLEAAARGIWLSVWHVEKNETSIDLVMRNTKYVEKFRDIAARPELGKNTTDRSHNGASRSTLQQAAPDPKRRPREGKRI